MHLSNCVCYKRIQMFSACKTKSSSSDKTAGFHWENVLLNEKKFTLDRPDDFHYYWIDLSKDKSCFPTHHLRDGSVIVWGGFAPKGTIPVV